MSPTWLFALSCAAGLATAAMLIPQVVKTWRQGMGKGVSLWLFVLSGVGNALWLAYALHKALWALVLVSVLAMLFSGLQVWLLVQSQWKRSPANQRRPSKGA